KCLAVLDPALGSHPFLSLTGRKLKAQKIVKMGASMKSSNVLIHAVHLAPMFCFFAVSHKGGSFRNVAALYFELSSDVIESMCCSGSILLVKQDRQPLHATPHDIAFHSLLS
ncbi:hypothetical protein NDU88_005859, partial [Pleurodeles waltl]